MDINRRKKFEDRVFVKIFTLCGSVCTVVNYDCKREREREVLLNKNDPIFIIVYVFL